MAPKKRQDRQRLLTVYVLPVLIGLAICVLAYVLVEIFNLEKSDRVFGCFIGIGTGYGIYVTNKYKWLPLGNGSYISIKELDRKTFINKHTTSVGAEPASYSAEFYTSVTSKIITLSCGIALLIIGIYMISKSSMMLPLLMAGGGVFMMYGGYRDLKDRSPKLKLAKNGLWTEALGFKAWNDISKAQVDNEEGGVYLNVFLKPDDEGIDLMPHRLRVDNIKDSENIQPLIDQLMNS